VTRGTPALSTTPDRDGKVVAIVGPTAVGKSAMAVRLAEVFGGEVVSLDSRQMYRRLDAGTAKPTPAELARAPHHLIDIAEPDQPLAVPDVQALAEAAIRAVLARGRLPIVAGGAGQYVRAVVEGWRIPAVAPDPALRAELEAVARSEGPAALHARLAEVDPVAAARIDARNVRRVVRALEVHARTGEPISAVQARAGSPFTWLVIGLTLPRDALYARIDARIDAMLAAGLEAEVRGLVAAGYGFALPALRSVGYQEWRDHLAGAIDAAEVVRLIRRNTRRLVRMQDAWFKRDDPSITWIDVSDPDGAFAAALARVGRFLADGGLEAPSDALPPTPGTTPGPA